MHSLTLSLFLLNATIVPAIAPVPPLKITTVKGKTQPAFPAKSQLLVSVKCDHRVCVKIRAGKITVQQCLTQQPDETGRCVGKLTAPTKPGRYQVEAYRKGVKVYQTRIRIE